MGKILIFKVQIEFSGSRDQVAGRQLRESRRQLRVRGTTDGETRATDRDARQRLKVYKISTVRWIFSYQPECTQYGIL